MFIFIPVFPLLHSEIGIFLQIQITKVKNYICVLKFQILTLGFI